MLLLAQRGLQGGAPSVLTRPNSDLVVGQGLVPSGAIWWDPTSGSNANNGSTKLLAKQTLAGVEAVVAPGGTVVVAAGIHAMALWVTPGVSGSSGSPITYMAEPGAVCGFGWNPQFAAFRTPGHSLFEVSDAATKTYRTKQPLQFAEGGVRGQWFEGGEWWDLLPEGTDGTNLGTGAAYLGPSARVRSDGRLYVRFQRPSSARTTSSWPSYHAGTSGGDQHDRALVPVRGGQSRLGRGWGSGKSEKALFTWFAARPLAQAKAAVLTSLLPWPDDQDEQRRLQKLVRQAMTGRVAQHGADLDLSAAFPTPQSSIPSPVEQ